MKTLIPDMHHWFSQLSVADGSWWEPSNPGGVAEGVRCIVAEDPYSDGGKVATLFYCGWPIFTLEHNGVEYASSWHQPVEDKDRHAQVIAAFLEQIGEAEEGFTAKVAEEGNDAYDDYTGQGYETIAVEGAVAWALHEEHGLPKPVGY